MSFDLLIANAHLVLPDRVIGANVAVNAGQIVAVGADVDAAARWTIDAAGLHLFPGLIDPHVHFNEPGRTDWEGIATGSAALAAGGGVCFIDMPLNASPPTLDGASFDLKLQAALSSSRTDFALWGGLTPHNLAHLPELAERGVIGFKAFMSNSGIDDFSAADDDTLYQGMRTAAALGLPVAVHAEGQQLVDGQTARIRHEKPNLSPLDWESMRPPIAESEAINRAIFLAQSAGCRLHIVHISNASSVDVALARRVGADVTIETCPHYYFLNRDDVARIGPPAKCAPPIRSAEIGDGIWQRVRDGSIDIIGSDHSPAPPSMKSGDFFTAWGGVAGVQSTLQTLLTRKPSLPLPAIARLTAANVADRFGLPGKGRITVGGDADFSLVDLADTFELTRGMLLDRHRLSPYVGRQFSGRVKQTFVRGHLIFQDGEMVGDFRGRLIRPRRGAIA